MVSVEKGGIMLCRTEFKAKTSNISEVNKMRVEGPIKTPVWVNINGVIRNGSIYGPLFVKDSETGFNFAILNFVVNFVEITCV